MECRSSEKSVRFCRYQIQTKLQTIAEMHRSLGFYLMFRESASQAVARLCRINIRPTQKKNFPKLEKQNCLVLNALRVLYCVPFIELFLLFQENIVYVVDLSSVGRQEH
jgi:hypothetical protein